MVFVPPAEDILLPDQVEGADELHALEVCGAELRHHGLKLAAVEHAHQYGLDHIVIMVAERNLVAAQFPGPPVKPAAPHSGADIAGGFFDVKNRVEDLRLEEAKRDAEEGGVFLDDAAVRLIVAGVHA